MSNAHSRALASLELLAQLRECLHTTHYEQMVAQWLGDKPGAYLEPSVVRQSCERLRAELTAALTFHVEEEMLPLLEWAGHDLPAGTALQPHDLPAAAGFLAFARTWPLAHPNGSPAPLRALSWHPGVGPVHVLREDVDHAPGTWITLWVEPEEAWLASGRRMLEATQGPQHWRDSAAEAVAEQRRHGQLRLWIRLFLPWGVPLDGAEPVGVDPLTGEVLDPAAMVAGGEANEYPRLLGLVKASMSGIQRLVAAAWLMLAQPVVSAVPEPLTVKQAAGFARRKVAPQVVVVTLRGPSVSRGEADAGAGGQWSHRWVVRGHWRRQAHGPELAQRRMVWIAPHVKGPEGTPLVVPQKVYRLTSE